MWVGRRSVARVPYKDPEGDAEKLLVEAWAKDANDLPFVPVDPIRIAWELGIDVATAVMDDSISAAIEKKIGSDPVIYLNINDRQNRQRFSCAHELGHYYLRTSATQGDELEYNFVDRRDHMARQGTDPDEIYANKFGAALIMPKRVVQRQFKSMRNPVQLALHFRVSEEAMRFRLQNLGLAS
jgi:Zn-dependent peptidase ImmA (M78 family)